MNNKDFFDDRLKYYGDLLPVVKRACTFYALPEPQSTHLFMTGFKDYSVKITTGREDAWVLKIFSKETQLPEIRRYEDIVFQAIQGGVRHPALRRGSGQELIYTDIPSDMYMSMVEYVPGTLMNEFVSIPEEIFKKVIAEAVKISMLDLHPPYRFDMWQVDNIEGLYDETRHVLHPVVRQKIEDVIHHYAQIVDDLPRGFVHGDMTRTNIIARSDHEGEVAILDFGASGIYPRIHELAILAAHFLADETLSLDSCIQNVCDEFIVQGGLLSSFERDSMLTYTQAILATKYMCNVYEIDEEIETEEMVYWRNISIIYLMADSDAENPNEKAKEYRGYYTPSMWTERIS